MSETTYYILIQPDTRGWSWGVYDGPQHRGIDRIITGKALTRWEAKRAVRREIKKMERLDRRKSMAYEIKRSNNESV